MRWLDKIYVNWVKYTFGYLLFIRNFVLVISLSLLSVPILIEIGGLTVWSSILIGQGLGLILSEFVSGGWENTAPRIFHSVGESAPQLYRVSLHERLLRLISVIIVGVVVIAFLFKENTIYISISFLTMAMNGVNPQWISTGSGEAKYQFRFWVFPKALSTTIALILLVQTSSVLIYLLVQLLGPICAILVLISKFHNSDIIFKKETFLGEKKQIVLILGNMLNAATPWVLILFLSIQTFDESPSLIAILRFIEMLFAGLYLLPLSQQARLIQSRSKVSEKNLNFLSLFLALSLIILVIVFFQNINEILFRGTIDLSQSQIAFLISTLFFRIGLELTVFKQIRNDTRVELIMIYRLLYIFCITISLVLPMYYWNSLEIFPCFLFITQAFFCTISVFRIKEHLNYLGNKLHITKSLSKEVALNHPLQEKGRLVNTLTVCIFGGSSAGSFGLKKEESLEDNMKNKLAGVNVLSYTKDLAKLNSLQNVLSEIKLEPRQMINVLFFPGDALLRINHKFDRFIPKPMRNSKYWNDYLEKVRSTSVLSRIFLEFTKIILIFFRILGPFQTSLQYKANLSTTFHGGSKYKANLVVIDSSLRKFNYSHVLLFRNAIITKWQSKRFRNVYLVDLKALRLVNKDFLHDGWHLSDSGAATLAGALSDIVTQIRLSESSTETSQ